jgi:hypothetical protein
VTILRDRGERERWCTLASSKSDPSFVWTHLHTFALRSGCESLLTAVCAECKLPPDPMILAQIYYDETTPYRPLRQPVQYQPFLNCTQCRGGFIFNAWSSLPRRPGNCCSTCNTMGFGDGGSVMDVHQIEWLFINSIHCALALQTSQIQSMFSIFLILALYKSDVHLE